MSVIGQPFLLQIIHLSSSVCVTRAPEIGYASVCIISCERLSTVTTSTEIRVKPSCACGLHRVYLYDRLCRTFSTRNISQSDRTQITGTTEC